MGYRDVSATVMNGVRASRRRRRQPVGRSVGKVSGGAAISIFYRGAAGGLVPCRAPTSRRERGTDCTLPPQRMHPASSTTATSSSSSSQQPPQLHASAALLTAPFRGPLGAARSDGAASHPSKLIVSPP